MNLNKDVQIVGDVHGSLGSLKTVLTSFFSNISEDPNFSILFLGDYIDRGSESLRCMLILLKLKTSFPNNVYLLRGNHEDDYGRALQRFFRGKTLFNECFSLTSNSNNVYRCF